MSSSEVLARLRLGAPDVHLGTSYKKGRLPMKAVGALVAYGAFAALFEPLTLHMRLVTTVPILLLFGAALARGWHKTNILPAKRTSRRVAGVWIWLIILAAIVVFNLMHFLEWPRSIYPTLSSLANKVFYFYPVRALSFFAWLWLGWYMVDR